jgi:nucleoside-triphosphatase THEP1
MYKNVEFASRVYQNELAKECMRLGYDVRLSVNTKGQIKGFELSHIDDDLIAKYSKRTLSINEAVFAEEKKLGRKLDQKEISTISDKLRQPKQKMSEQELRDHQLKQMTGAELKTVLEHEKKTRGENLSQLDQANEEILNQSANHLSERESIMRENKILSDALAQNIGRVDLDELRHDLDGNANIIHISDNNEKVFATKETLQKEWNSIAWVKDGKQKFETYHKGAVDISNVLADAYAQAEAKGWDLESLDQQAEAIRNVLNSKDVATFLEGAPGVGKTTVQNELKDLLVQAGWEVDYVAPTSAAKERLLEEGLTAQTLDKWMIEAEKGAFRDERKVLIVDEAGFMSQELGSRLEKLQKEKGFRIIFAGDRKQISGVAAGDYVDLLASEGNMRTANIDKIVRQANKAEAKAIETMRENPQEGLDAFDALEHITEDQHYLDKAAQKYLELDKIKSKDEEITMSANTWAEINILTDNIRSAFIKQGKIDNSQKIDREVFADLGWSAEEIRRAEKYKPGMIIDNGRDSRMTVKEVKNGRLIIEDKAGKISTKNPEKFGSKFSVSIPQNREFAKGDKILLRKNKKDQEGYKDKVNGERATITKIDKDGTIFAKNKSGSVIKIPNNYKHLAHGYACTPNGNQGASTAFNIYAAVRSTAEKMLVGASRGKISNLIFTKDKQTLKSSLPRQNTARKSATSQIKSKPAKRLKKGIKRGLSALNKQAKRKKARSAKSDPLAQRMRSTRSQSQRLQKPKNKQVNSKVKNPKLKSKLAKKRKMKDLKKKQKQQLAKKQAPRPKIKM